MPSLTWMSCCRAVPAVPTCSRKHCADWKCTFTYILERHFHCFAVAGLQAREQVFLWASSEAEITCRCSSTPMTSLVSEEAGFAAGELTTTRAEELMVSIDQFFPFWTHVSQLKWNQYTLSTGWKVWPWIISKQPKLSWKSVTFLIRGWENQTNAG